MSVRRVMVDIASQNDIAADRWLRHLERHVSVAREGKDSEGKHQMRVAIARLRVWLALAGCRILDDDLRWQRDRLAPARDLDVQLEHDPPPSWAAILRRRRAGAQRELVATLEHSRLSSLLSAFAGLPLVSGAEAWRRVPGMARRVLRRAPAASAHGDDLESLHRLRCIARRLRFALEWLDVDTADRVGVQDTRVRHYRTKLVRDLLGSRRRARVAFRQARPHLEDLACSSS